MFCMLGGAPVLYGTGRNFLCIGDKACGIIAVDAMNLFDSIKVLQSVAVHDDVVSALNIRDAINWKADAMIDFDENIEQ